MPLTETQKELAARLVVSENTVTGIPEKTKVSDLVAVLGGTVTDALENSVSGNSFVGTGFKIKIGGSFYICIVLFDVDGNGFTDFGDVRELAATAADAPENLYFDCDFDLNDRVDEADCLWLLKYIIDRNLYNIPEGVNK